MQIDLFVMDQATAYPMALSTTCDQPTTTDGVQLLDLCNALHTATDADEYAVLVDAVLRLILPRAEQIAALGMASMPPGQVEVDDLAQELLLEVTAALPFAPNTSVVALMAWLSTTLLDALHGMWRSAVQARRRDAVARHLAAERAAEWATDIGHAIPDSEAGEDEVVRPLNDIDSKRRRDLALVLGSLDVREARLLSLRAAGHSWRAIGRVLRISARTAQGAHDRALVAARRAALEVDVRSYEDAA